MEIDKEFYEFQTKIRQHFNPVAIEVLCESERKRIQPIISDIIEDVKKKPNAKVLDVPCGYGNLLYLYKFNNISASGIDIDVSQVELARKTGLNAEVKNFFDFDAAFNFDLISCFDFIEHVSKNEALMILKRIYGLLNDGGILILRTPCGDTGFGLKDFAEDPTHKWIGTSNCIESMLKISRFSSVSIREDWPLFNRYRFPRLLVARLLRRIYRLWLRLVGHGSPNCLSSSMIIIARK
jgi:SAM-dependent methyltransferase